MDATWSRSNAGSEWTAAVELAKGVAAGGELPSIPSPVLLDAGEVLHADLPAQGWRFHGADVTYAAPRVVAIGGPLIFGLLVGERAPSILRAILYLGEISSIKSRLTLNAALKAWIALLSLSGQTAHLRHVLN